MSSVLLFGGTREGHLLAKALVEKGQPVTLSVATEYGEMVLEPALRRSPLLEGPFRPAGRGGRWRSGWPEERSAWSSTPPTLTRPW